jgi:hypothetical protein
VDERFIAREQAVPSGEQVALQPALAGVLGQDLHHPAVRCEVLVDRLDGAAPDLVGDLQHCAQPVGFGLVRADQPEVALGRVGRDHVA